MWRSRQLQPCCKQPSLFIQLAPRGGCPTSREFQWLDQTLLRKKSTGEIFVSTLNDWFVCSGSSLKSVPVARSAASINCQFFVFLFSSVALTDLFHRPHVAVKFCWSFYVLRFMSETSMEFYFPWFTLYVASAFQFASHLTKSVFRSFPVMVVSFQMPVALYCMLM